MAFGGFRAHKISGVAVDPETVGLQFREIESKVVLLHLRLFAPDLLFITVLPETQGIISPSDLGIFIPRRITRPIHATGRQNSQLTYLLTYWTCFE